MTAALPQPSGEGSDWTVETLRQYTVEALATRDRSDVERSRSRDQADSERDRRYQERFEAQTKALDAAFLAQQTAMQTALTAAERAVQAALLAAKEAAATLAVATNQRLETMNEFRGTVQDVLAKSMPRAEAEARLLSILEKMADANRRADDAQKQLIVALAALDSRVVGAEQRDKGGTDNQAVVVRLVMMAIAAVGVIASIYFATH